MFVLAPPPPLGEGCTWVGVYMIRGVGGGGCTWQDFLMGYYFSQALDSRLPGVLMDYYLVGGT